RQHKTAGRRSGRPGLCKLSESPTGCLHRIRSPDFIQCNCKLHIQTAFNGVAIAIEPDRVNELLKLPGVRRVYPDQIQTIKLNASTPLINAPAAWEVLGGQDQAGSGVF